MKQADDDRSVAGADGILSSKNTGWYADLFKIKTSTLSGQEDTRLKYRLLAAGGVSVNRCTGTTPSDSSAAESLICGVEPCVPCPRRVLSAYAD